MDIPRQEPAVAPVVAAGLLLAARTVGAELGLPVPSVGAIVEATGVGRSRAYELKRELLSLLPSLLRPPGRPRNELDTVPAPDGAHALRLEVLRFVMARPGCVNAGPARTKYAGVFRRFVLEQIEQHPDLPLPAFADAVQVPLGTIEDWLRPGHIVDDEPTERAEAEPDLVTVSQVETVIDAWRHWHGKDLGPFVEHLREHLHLRFGRGAVADILFEYGERTPARRQGRRYADEEALRGAFETYFAGAQWVGDGTEITVTIGDDSYCFNLELIVDAHSSGWVGIDVRDAEDSDAVIAAFEQGKQTTGQPPLALLLDNKECNHTEEVDTVLGEDTLHIPATLSRPQNKAHVEGAFGLFAQEAPPIVVDATERRDLARQILLLAASSFARGLNRRPRRDRGGKSRVDLYTEPVTDAERERAKQQLRERLEQQERARKTRDARRDPVVAAYLDDAFERLGLLDPERRFRDALATHRLGSVVDAIAIFEAKCERATLPKGADARYLLGIVKNIEHVHESDAITEALLRERLALRDRLLEPLRSLRDQHLDSAKPHDALRSFIDSALATDRNLDEHFWLDAAADVIRQHPESERQDLFRAAARRIHATFRVDRQRRNVAERRLLHRLWPVD